MSRGDPAPFEYVRWTLIERFHWTPQEFDQVHMADLHEFFQVEDGRQKGDRMKDQIAKAKAGGYRSSRRV